MAKNKSKTKAKTKKSDKTKKGISLSPAIISNFFTRYHALIFTIVVVGSLAVAVFFLHLVIASSDTPADYAPEQSTNFDEDTMERVRELTPSTQPAPSIDLPSGRTDPFRS